jgi:pilus assembly protein CpaF
VGRVCEKVDLRPLDAGAPADEALAVQIDRALGDAAPALRDSVDIDLDVLIAEARREIRELGPLSGLLDDEDVSEVEVFRHDYVVAVHAGRLVPSEVAFTSEEAVGRAIRRLCHASGAPLLEDETFVERRLARGVRLFAILPRAEDRGHLVVIRKPQRADLSLEDLVRSGTISRAMASVLVQCVAARANILVTGSRGGATTLVGALAGAGGIDDRVVVLQEGDELVLNQPHTVSIPLADSDLERARAVQTAAHVRPDRLVAASFAGATAAELVDAITSGLDGVVAAARAPSLRQAVLRLASDVATRRPGISAEVARDWLGSVFDLTIEVARLRDGRHRVLRIAELTAEGLRDVFTFTVERTAAGGAIEGSFAATGVVPRVLEDLAARGVTVDTSIFKRHARPEPDTGPQPSPRVPSGDAPKSPARP